MSLLNITAESLSRELGKDVPPAYVVIAKHLVMGMGEDSIRDVLNCTSEEILEAKADPLYEEVRLIIATKQAEFVTSQSASWDEVEQLALGKLIQRVQVSTDPDFLLRVAAVGNKAQRRVAPIGQPLDPSRNNGHTAIRLTERLVRKIRDQSGRTGIEVEERQLSIMDGSMQTPSFEEVDDLLSVSVRPPRIQTHTPEPTLAELEEDLEHRIR